MKAIHQVAVDLGDRGMTFETGRMAWQAGGAVTVRLGDTVLMSAATASATAREGVDFLPLQIEYREKFYAAGRFPGGYFKREARPSEKEVLTARATDRPLRPLFPEGYHNEVQVINLLLSADGENESDILSINAASAALMLSEIPFMGPVGAVRVARIEGAFVTNPTHSERAKSDLDLVYVGNAELPLMIEGSAQECPEADLIAAMQTAHESVRKLIEAQLELRRLAGLPAKEMVEAPAVDAALLEAVREQAGAAMDSAMALTGKQERQAALAAARDALLAQWAEQRPDVPPATVGQVFHALEIEKIRRKILEQGQRADGRGPEDLRTLTSSVGLLPRTHGSALFSRGETQVLAAVTLGTLSDTQSMDAVTGGVDEKSFMLHYNFPPYSVGETGRIGFTSRREIGHGALAERSLQPVMPENYSYTVRVVSEVMGSNGSSSMATVCAATLALMDAGVPLRKPVAGISIGLVSEGDQAVLLTDILGVEDHCGDMDFKVAGTGAGVTGFQVDLKIRGLSWELLEQAFERARQARLKILGHMQETLAEPRAEMSPYAPRVHVMKIDTEKIGALIGPGGKNIRRITDTTGAQIDIEDDGSVHIFATDQQAMDAAVAEVSALTAEAEIGQLYHGKVTGIKDFGAFVEILPGKDGLVHISQLADFRVNNVEDVCKVGDMMWVKCIGVDDRGKIRLSRREAMEDKAGEADA